MRRTFLLPILGLVSLAGCSSGGGGNIGNADCPGGLKAAKFSEFCAGDPAVIDCGRVAPSVHDQVCGVALSAPKTELARSQDVEEYAGTGAPQLGCFDPANAAYPKAPGASKMITVEGTAVVFSHGCESNDLTIEIKTVKRTGGEDDAMPDQLVGTKQVTAAECKTTGVPSEIDECGTRYECTYVYPNVPTETELVIVTSGDLWSPLYDYNIYISNEDAPNGKWAHNVRALASDDYGVIAQAAIGRTISPGHGAVAGEVHDCGDVRLQNAIVDVDVDKVRTMYFSDNEDHPLPDNSKSATSTLGLYASFDIAPGVVNVASMGLSGGQLVTTGFFRARVFPDSVTAVTHRGLRPFQLP